VNRKTFLPIFWPLLLLFYAQLDGGLLSLIEEYRLNLQRLENGRRHLESLKARVVAGRIVASEYETLLDDFATQTNLPASDPFRDPQAATVGSIQVASLVSGLQVALNGPEENQRLLDLEFLPVSLGDQQRIGPFVMVEFALNLRGRYRAVPEFLGLLAQLGQQRRLVLSIGELRVDSTEMTQVNGELAITLPLRAYFRD
jgi:hypothetical protein